MEEVDKIKGKLSDSGIEFVCVGYIQRQTCASAVG
jgi:hypothetical protein